MQGLLAFFSDGAFSPHGFCLAWNPAILWLHVTSDSVIAVAYFGIAAALWMFVRRRDDLALGWMFWMFAVFILACGITHVFDVVTLWQPLYALQGVAKAVTAAASILTAILLWPMIPRALAMPTPAELRRVNSNLSNALARQERAEEALRQSEHRYRLLVDSVTDYAIFMLDETGRVSNWNPGAQRIKGYAASEIVGEHFSRFYSEEDRAARKPQRDLDAATRSEGIVEEGWRVRKDGSRFWASSVLHPVRDDEGALIGFAKITRDITEKRAAAEALEASRALLAQSQKMEAVGQLTGGIAHDFNNLLTAILGSLDMLARRPADSPEGRRFLETARHAAERGADLTRRLLAFGRRQALLPKPTDVNKLVTGFSELLRRTLGERVQFATALSEGLWYTFVDPNQLENAVLNLAVNARDAMPAGGRLTIETSNTQIAKDQATGDLPAGEYVVIAVSDTGTGMTDDVIARAFEPFFTTKPEGRGTGLGLSQVFGFIKQSGGHVTIASRLGEGTRISLYLPRHHEVQERDPPPAEPSVERIGSGETVLLVEDDPDVQHYASEALTELGFSVVTASDAPAALRVLQSDKTIEILVSDVGLPGRSGRRLADEARCARPELKVLLTTGYARHEALRSGLGGDMAILQKPFTLETLASKLREVVRQHAVT